MSQAKVDYKQQQKKNRKADLKKKKAINIVRNTIVSIVCIAVIGWIGFSVYQKVDAAQKANATIEHVETDLTPISDYLSGLDAE